MIEPGVDDQAPLALDIRERVAQRTFQLYEGRGREDGHDVEDWLQAEQEVIRHLAAERGADSQAKQLLGKAKGR
jgi:Protein of unknown function (DUF2934)